MSCFVGVEVTVEVTDDERHLSTTEFACVSPDAPHAHRMSPRLLPHSNPGCGNAEAALNTVLADCKYPEDLWAALGKPIAMGAVEELIEAAACVDPSFQKQVQAIWETGT